MTGKKKYGIIYTILFAMLFMACFGIYLIVKHKSFLRVPDGLNQYYLGFLYIGRWGRSIFRNLFENHRFQILLWDPSIGYGADVPTTFSYCFWDPFCWISFFIPSRYAEYGYEIMILLKLYTAGLVFSKYAFHRLSKGRYSSAAILAGALVYTFSAVSWSAFGESFLINF
ncbi:MAG: YfhO family protein, partial [Eubacterium sp.]|nr:YfhO family protein [Eubacterium sp.]